MCILVQCNTCNVCNHVCRHTVPSVLYLCEVEPPLQDKVVAGTEGWSITELEELRVLLIRQVQLPTLWASSAVLLPIASAPAVHGDPSFSLDCERCHAWYQPCKVSIYRLLLSKHPKWEEWLQVLP